MVREDGYVKLLDFGVARLLSAPAAAESRTDDGGHQSRRHHRHATLHVARTGARRDGDRARATCSRSASSCTSSPRARTRSSRSRRSERCTPSFHAPRRDPLAGCRRPPAVLERLLLPHAREGARRRARLADEVEAELTRLAAALSERVRLDPSTGGGRGTAFTTFRPSARPLIGRTAELDRRRRACCSIPTSGC